MCVGHGQHNMQLPLRRNTTRVLAQHAAPFTGVAARGLCENSSVDGVTCSHQYSAEES